MKVSKGTKFRSAHADSNALWEVTKKVGKGVWEAVIIPEAYEVAGKTMMISDYAGTIKAFFEQEILRTIRFKEMCDKQGQDSDQWFDALPLGSVVHARDSFDAYTRCHVVLTPSGKMLQAVALVGNWRKHDLPSRYVTGEINYGYHAEKIRNVKPYRPHASHLWEYQHDKKDIDPRGLKPISLELPPLTFEEERTAHFWKIINNIRKACDGLGEETAEDILKRLGAIVGHNLIIPAHNSFKPTVKAKA